MTGKRHAVAAIVAALAASPLFGCEGAATDDECDDSDCADASASCPEREECSTCADGGGGREPPDGGSGSTRRPLDLRNDADNVYAWRRVRGSLDPEEEVVFYWTGHVFAVTPPDPSRFASPGPPAFGRPIFRFEGFNVARFAEDPAGGYVMLSREAAFYEDTRTREILECWDNTLSDLSEPVRVLQVWNDPVNFGVGPVEHVEHGDRVIFQSDVFISYRSPLAGEERYLPYSASDVYQGAEMFNFYASRADLEDESLASVPVEISWTRVGQFLPWMQMGDTPGHLVYSARGWKLEGGYDELPAHIRQYVEEQDMGHFAHAPEANPAGYVPNDTTWRSFAAALDSSEYDPRCE